MTEFDIQNLINNDISKISQPQAKSRRIKALEAYYKNPNYCKYCGKIIQVGINNTVSDAKRKIYCDVKCSTNDHKKDINNAMFKKCVVCGDKIANDNLSGLCKKCKPIKEKERKIKEWLDTGDIKDMKLLSKIPQYIKEYILNEQDCKCEICGMQNEWNNKPLVFILDHIDGDASKNNRSNLRMICPNCDSQLPTYKSKNKNSARQFRHKYS